MMMMLWVSDAYLGYNVGTGQMSVRVPDDTWMQWMTTATMMEPTGPHLKYYWRDVDQVRAQRDRWGNETTCIVAVQNEELPLTLEMSRRILDVFFSWSPHPIKAFAIGNEADAGMTPLEFSGRVLTSLRVFHEAILERGERVGSGQMMVSTPITLRMFDWEALVSPTTEWQQVLYDLVTFLVASDSPFMINVYPYLSWQGHPDMYSLEHALTGLFQHHVDRISEILRDVVRTLSLDRPPPLWITETGWSTEGAEGATLDNAYRYWKSTQDFVVTHPTIPVYWFEWIDEDLKPGSTDEHHYGVYTHYGASKFPA